MAESTAIARAVLTVLQQDAQLKTLLPDGVWKNTAPPGVTRFGILGVMDSDDRGVFGRRAIEAVTYFVKAVMLSTANGDLSAAFDRIDALLSDTTYPVAGYVLMASYRDEDRPLIDYDEVDRLDPTLRYRHLGGHYRVMCSVPGPSPRG